MRFWALLGERGQTSALLHRGRFDPRRRTLLPPHLTLIALVGLAMAYWTWNRWADPIIDFGRELYVPWQLCQGKVLYRDLHYFNGPLSPYLNALWFRSFGTSLRTLECCNLGIVVLTVILIYRLILTISDRAGATMACIMFLAVFAFAQPSTFGNYNYVCPYSHELPHGMLLSLLALQSVSVHTRRWQRRWLVCGGGCMGMVFLTKPEVLLAALPSVLLALGLSLWARRCNSREAIARGLLLCAGAVLILIVSFLALRLSMTSREAWWGIAGAWKWVGDGRLTHLLYYRRVMGTDDLSGNLRSMLLWLLGYLLVFGIPTVSALLLPQSVWRRWGIFLATLATSLWLVQRFHVRWQHFVRPAPLLLLALLFSQLTSYARLRDDEKLRGAIITAASITVFAALLMGKMLFNATTAHYGFVLAMPAAIVISTAAVRWWPRWADRKSLDGDLIRMVAVGLWLVTLGIHLAVAYRVLSEKKTRLVGPHGDLLLVDARGVTVNDFLHELAPRRHAGQTLAMVPDGLMINFLLRMENPTGYLQYLPPELIMHGEDKILRECAMRSPDYIGDVGWEKAVYPEFGRSIGVDLIDWVDANYEPIATTPPHDADGRWQMRLLRHRASPVGETAR